MITIKAALELGTSRRSCIYRNGTDKYQSAFTMDFLLAIKTYDNQMFTLNSREDP